MWRARVDGQCNGRDVPRLVGSQEQAGVGHVNRLDPWDRQHVHLLCRRGELVAGWGAIEVRAEGTADGGVLDERSVDVRGMYRIHPNIVRRELVGQAPHQPDHTVLGGGVVGDADEATQARDRADEHDRTTAALDHMRSGGAARPPDTGQVDVEHCAPGVLVEIGSEAP